MADGARRAGLLPLDDALALIRQVVRPIAGTEPQGIADALGRVVASDIRAPRSLPPFDNSAVDGYAFRYPVLDDPDFVVEGSAMACQVQGESAAGVPFGGTMRPGAAIRISTGAVLPAGADTIAMQEDCSRTDAGGLRINPVPPKGANVRYAGDDIREGDIAIAAGHRLRPQDIALLGGLGLISVDVTRRLRVAIAATGAELRAAGADLAAGQIIETNGLMLRQLLAHYPADVTVIAPLPDDRAQTEAALIDAGGRYDLIITTGGVSVGDHDHVRPALTEKGRVHFWRLALRPGKPALFGEIGQACMLGLPGNPVSAMVTFLVVALPVINALLGVPAQPMPGFTVPLAEPVTKSPKLREFPRARIARPGGVPQAVPYRDQSSNLLTSLAWADGLLDLPEGIGALDAGAPVIYRPFAALLA